MSSLFEGELRIVKVDNKYVLKGFTLNDWSALKKMARKSYKLKTKRSRIVNKYVKKLINDALRKHVQKGVINGKFS